MQSSSRQTTGKWATAYLVVALLFFRAVNCTPVGVGQPISEEEYEAALKALIEELDRQGLIAQVLPFPNAAAAAMGPTIAIVDPTTSRTTFRKYVNPSDYRLRYGKRSVPLVPETSFLCPHPYGKTVTSSQGNK